MREKNIFLENKKAIELYKNVKDLPIIDYHCHLSPKEIYEDKEFSDIGEMWLASDHYKWRVMRAYGIAEEYITGSKSYKEKFLKFAEAMSMAAGNPLYHWCKLELLKYFNIELPLNKDNAEMIFERANKFISENHLSPRKLIENSGVEYIATTDDITDSLEYHKKINADTSFNVKVVPTFRTDNLLMIKREDYNEYLKKLSDSSKTEIKNFSDFKKAVENRLDYFKENGCKFTDVGIPIFPNVRATEIDAQKVFDKLIEKEQITNSDINKFIYYMYIYLAEEYKKRNIVMQMHLCVKRNVNSMLYKNIGADCGGDCVGEAIPLDNLATLFDEINEKSGFPKTILYTLNSTMYSELSTLAGSFNNVTMGAAWWFEDNKDGIKKLIRMYAQNLNLSTFLGMLTDSRSFLSYTRHDYFRRILCSVVGEWIENKELNDDKYATELVKNICYYNIKNLTGEQ